MLRTMKRIAVVTGANRGIGLAIAKLLAKSGAHVVLTSRDPSKGEAAASEIRAEGLSVETAALDVTREESARELATALTEAHGGIDILVNNAGIAMDGFNAEVAQRTIETNYFGPLRVTESFLPSIRKGWRIVMVSSGVADRSRLSAGLRKKLAAKGLTREELSELMSAFVAAVARGDHEAEGWPSSAYCVSKIGLNRLTEILGEELSADGRGILCNAACPGWVRTDMGGRSAPRSPEKGAETPVWLALAEEGGPQGGFFRDKAPAAW
jgi:NAD(P)-dependent dehydrogenase (short-subunit alcohol dehydrogenase family)